MSMPGDWCMLMNRERTCLKRLHQSGLSLTVRVEALITDQTRILPLLA